MPSINQYDKTRPVYVQPYNGSPILYGFKTNCKAATSTACGHTDVDYVSLPQNIVFGARAPKPGRASRLNGDEYESSYYFYANFAALKTDGWATTRPFVRRPSTSSRSVTVAVSTNSDGNATGPIKYAWNMPIGLFTKINDELAGLGIELPDATATNLVFGANSPRPPRASKTVTGAGGTDILTTFVAPAKFNELPAGWAPAGGSRQYIAVG